ncbi:hypothetical protein A1O3_07504 [Capronia epimyces CBS 606.96]|uniref:Uncharacterized protein n=1 Tax=Capronia epimyces CBS 606.96 TaxID=1182542 RepID=W9YFZ2_9EURO|nr:uncharacterized protein A1O3_07504 [Capronia epimyces CBS 606.96]EXJ81214.1 hypothetical protein A1O3_07504 [Capronia epimyces CBS 606.96]
MAHLSPEVIVSIVFGIFMAIVALGALVQVAYYAARGFRTEESRSDSFELEA